MSVQVISLFLLTTGRIQKNLGREDGRIQRDLYSERVKHSERLVLRAVPDEAFLYKKTNNRDVYVDYGSTAQINDAFS